MRLPNRLVYILVARIPTAVDFITWAEWMETADRHVGLTQLEHCRVSTVFLGIDHNFSGSGPPLLFETMAFSTVDNDALNMVFERYTTWRQAEAGHARWVERARVVEAEMERSAQVTLDRFLQRVMAG